ncbi:hypothetical protein GCM10027185_58640 [Spirosoma pulveris]
MQNGSVPITIERYLAFYRPPIPFIVSSLNDKIVTIESYPVALLVLINGYFWQVCSVKMGKSGPYGRWLVDKGRRVISLELLCT